MVRARRLIFAILVVAAVQAPCQETPGKRVDIGFDLAGIRASALDVGAGLDIARFLGLGVVWGLGLDDPGIYDLQLGVWASATLLSEGEMKMPVTLVIQGRFAKVRSLGDPLTGQSLVRSGTIGTLGLDVSRTFVVGPKLGFLVAAEASYTYTTMTTEAIAGSGSTFQTLIVPAAQILYGVRIGLNLAVAEKLSLLMGIRVRLDGSFHIHYGPVFSLLTR